MMGIISKSFSHFAKVGEVPKDITFKTLRKTYISKIQLALGQNSHLVTGHSSQKVLEDHYIDKALIAKVASSHNLFPELDAITKQNELEKIRSKNNTIDNSLEKINNLKT
jgi:intergrase/recombinase